MKIDALKLAGFKSFADAVEMPVGKGITGIVGPNGCGKSNLIESFRWAMGETAPSRVRADGMDDVIFGGTDLRPPRSSAEVTITIDNTERLAPVDFNNEDKLEVARRIVRGDGTSYKVNGKPARARDVQILFKDAGIGAGSSALVSQGKVASIINAKPSERRIILEEAAGVTGITARKKEAESKFRATEANLERAEDMERGLSDQLHSLKAQARKAKRRKDIDGLIRAAEAQMFLVRWLAASSRMSDCDLAYKANEEAVKTYMIALQAAERVLADAEKATAPLIQARIEAETTLALAKAKVESVRKEAQAARSAHSSAQRVVDRTKTDLEREKASIGSSGDEYEDLKDRKALAEDDRDYDSVLIEEASIKVEETRDALIAITTKVQAMAEELSASKMERTAAERRVAETKARLLSEQAKVESAKQKLLELQVRLGKLPPIGDEVHALEMQVSNIDGETLILSDELTILVDKETAARSAYGVISSQLKVVSAEHKALVGGAFEDNIAGSIIIVKEGYEKAFAAALGDGLTAAIGEGQQRWWMEVNAAIAHPVGSLPLKDFALLPPELDAAISAIGVVNSKCEAAEIAQILLPGQAITTPEGDLFRWDGFRSTTGDGSEETIKRAARIRLLEAEIGDLSEQERVALSDLDVAIRNVAETKEALEARRNQLKVSRRELEILRTKVDAIERERVELSAKIETAQASLEEYAEQVEVERVSALEADQVLIVLPDQHAEEYRLKVLRQEQSTLSVAYENARTCLDKVKRDAEARILLIQNIVQQINDFDKRLVAAKERVQELDIRFAEAIVEVEALAELVAQGPELEDQTLVDLEEAAIAHEAAVSQAAEADTRLATARHEAKDADLALSAKKEDRARLLAEVKASQDATQELTREIADRLNCAPSELRTVAVMAADEDPADLQSCEARLQRLIRERDTIGVVNLLAEKQVEEVEAHLGTANKQREELREAVKRLRSTIAEFDREARERLVEAFSLIDGYFRELFTKLFTGGHAHLSLSGSEDILEAGLEIYACPPGKKMQTMSLMSGGEQALTALALVFAAFLIRPAPVCVLDEVDAALDDANIDKFCTMIEDLASKNTTRFLVITHRELTMSRCHRLFGVTMMEKGVSKLTSLDMETAIRLVSE